MAQPPRRTLIQRTVQRLPSVVASSPSASRSALLSATTQRSKGAKQLATSIWRRCCPCLSFSSYSHSRKRWRQLSSLPPSSKASKALFCVRPALPTSSKLRLQQASTAACGRERCGRKLDTLCFHCDTCCVYVMALLLIRNSRRVSPMIAHSHDDLLFFCLLSAAFLAFPKKPPRVSPQGVALRETRLHRRHERIVYSRATPCGWPGAA